jgi:YVTN family beta-propeller protein
MQLVKYLTTVLLLGSAFFGNSQEITDSEKHYSLQLIKTISGSMSPKSVVHSGTGYFLSQHMMYKHKILVHNRDYELIATISDKITPSDFNHEGEHELNGAPVECTFSHNGKYAWISNYNMTGPGFKNPGCDACNSSKYDSSFIYKVDMTTFQITNIIAVGAVPKFMATSPNDSVLLVSNWSSGDVSVVSLNQEKEIKRIKVGAHPRGIVITSDSKKAYVAIMGSSKIVEINLSTYATNIIPDIGKNPRHLCLDSKDETLYVSLNGEGKIGKYNLPNKTIVKIKTGSMPRSMALCESGQFLYVVNYGGKSMSKIKTSDFSIQNTIETGNKPIGITIDNKLGRIWVACYSGKLNIFQDSALIQELDLVDRTLLSMGNPNAFIPNIKHESSTLESVDSASLTKQREHKEVESFSSNTRYYLIIGSFNSKANAEKERLRWEKEGFNSKIIRSNSNRNLVSIETAKDKSKLLEKLKIFKEKLQTDLWIYSQR